MNLLNTIQNPSVLGDAVAGEGANMLDPDFVVEQADNDGVNDFDADDLQHLADLVYDLLRKKIDQERLRSGLM